jgi:hypothetical protein
MAKSCLSFKFAAMPLTFAHPAAILPAKYLPKKWYSWTALIVGSVVPDFEAFIKLGGEKKFSHSWVGMFGFDLPVGIVLMILFHVVVRDAVIDQFPSFFYKRFCILKKTDWIHNFKERYAVIIISLLVGIATHLIWDRLTHTDTYTYYQKAGIYLGDKSEEVRRWLQWLSSFVGLILLFWLIAVLPVHNDIPRKKWSNFLPVVVTVALLIFILRAFFPYIGDDMINTSIGAVLWGIIVACYIVYRRRTRLKENLDR